MSAEADAEKRSEVRKCESRQVRCVKRRPGFFFRVPDLSPCRKANRPSHARHGRGGVVFRI
jgi:hypothetical protein